MVRIKEKEKEIGPKDSGPQVFGKGKMQGKGNWNWKWKGSFGFKGKGKGKGKSKGKGKGKGGKGKAGCFNCGSTSHWSRDCPMSRQSGVIEGQTGQTEETEQNWQSWDDAVGVIDGTWEDWNGFDDWSWYDDSGDWFDWTGAVFDDGWSYDDWNAFDWWQDDWAPDRETTEEQQGPPLETSAIIPSLGQPLIEEIDDEAEAVSAALPSQASSSGGRTRAPSRD